MFIFHSSIVGQSLSHVQLFATPWFPAHQVSLSFTMSWSLLKFTCTELVMLSDHLILCHPLLLLPSIFPASGPFPVSSSSHQVAKYWSFSFSISHSNEYSGLISFRIDCFDLPVVQGTLKNLLQPQFKRMNPGLNMCSQFSENQEKEASGERAEKLG